MITWKVKKSFMGPTRQGLATPCVVSTRHRSFVIFPLLVPEKPCDASKIKTRACYGSPIHACALGF